MKQEEIFIAGSGGQGVLSAGKILAQTAIQENKYAIFYPSYGAEIRGGTTNCTVIISDTEIFSPVIEKFKNMIILNAPSLNKFLNKLSEDGLLIINSSLCEINQKTLKNIKLLEIPATEISLKLGDVRCANIFMLGFYIGIKKILTESNIIQTITNFFEKNKKLVELNIIAFKEGIKKADELYNKKI